MTDNRTQPLKELGKSSTAGTVSPEVKKELTFTFDETTGFCNSTVSNGFDYNNEETTDEHVISKEDKENFYKKTLHSDIL